MDKRVVDCPASPCSMLISHYQIITLALCAQKALVENRARLRKTNWKPKDIWSDKLKAL